MFYRYYQVLTAQCCGVWFLIKPDFSCTDGQGHTEEQIHVERILKSLEPDQPFLVTILSTPLPGDFEEVKTRLNFSDSCQTKPGHPIGVMELDLQTGVGFKEALAWFEERVPPKQPETRFCQMN